MRKWIGFAALLAGLAVVSVPALPLADAQDKKEAKKDGKKAEAKKEAAGTVEIYKAKDGFRFRIKDADGKVLAMPAKGYAEKDDVVKALETIKATLNKVKPVEEKE